jgi:Zn-dependent peptidase ImmA (M78 family)
MSIRFARHQAEKLIQELAIRGPRVDVEAVAEVLGLPIHYDDLGDSSVSGLLVSDGKNTAIFIKQDDAPVRQRFSIAHEIGHHVLGHQFEDGQHVHVDRGHIITPRDSRSSTGEDPREVEANQFAAALLMPHHFIRARATAVSEGGPLRDYHVSQLAGEFDGSEQAMTIRLTGLGLL